MQHKEGINVSGRLYAMFAAVLFSTIMLLTLSTLVSAEEEVVDLTVTKTVTGGSHHPGGTIEYTIVVSATGSDFAGFQITDTLPMSTTYVPNSLSITGSSATVTETNGVIMSMPAALNAGDAATIKFSAMISSGAQIGDVITNTVMLKDMTSDLESSASAAVTVEKLTDPIDLFVEKQVTGGDYLPGGTLEYSIVVSYTGDSFTTFQITDTLPAELTYVPGTLTSTVGFNVAENSGVLSSPISAINGGQSVQASFMVTIDASTAVSTVITNTVMMNDIANDLLLSDSVAATVITVTVPTTFYAYMPYVFNAIPAPIANGIAAPSGTANNWTVTWSDSHSANANITGYTVEEATDMAFTQNVVTTPLGKVTSLPVSKPAGTSQTIYYYRVRAIASGLGNGIGLWSNTTSVLSVFRYEETFDDASNPTGWKIVRQDTDDVVNKLNVVPAQSGHPSLLDLRMESRFDYMIASNLTQLPDAPFTLKARMRLEDADPRHAGGIILRGDWDGVTSCPVSDTDYSSCFNQYYRFMFIAGNVDNQMLTQIKRIKEHSETNNSGSGDEIAAGTQILNGKSHEDWFEWTLEVLADGTINFKLNGATLHSFVDTDLNNMRYFGFWSSTSDTTFSNTQIDWVTIEKN